MRRLGLTFATVITLTLLVACDDDSGRTGPNSSRTPTVNEPADTSAPVPVRPVPSEILFRLDQSGVDVTLSSEVAAVGADKAVATIRAERPNVSNAAERITASLGRVSSESDPSSNRPQIDDQLVWIVVLHNVPGEPISCRIGDPTCQQTNGKNTMVAFITSDEPARLVAEHFFNPSHQRR